MSNINLIDTGKKFAHASVGRLSEFDGKLFFKDVIGTTSCEISFGTLPTGAAVPFFHSHKSNEENYIILSGKGKFQVDNNVFDIAEGSVIRVATNCNRDLKCTSAEPMTYICIQAKEGSLEQHTASDVDINEIESML